MGVALDRASRQHFGERPAGLVLHAFRHRDDAAAESRIDRIDIVEELRHRECLFRRIDQMRRIVRRLLPAGGGGGEEAGMAAHDDGDIDAGHGAEIEIHADERAPTTKAAAEMKPGTWSFSIRSLSMVLGACTKRRGPVDCWRRSSQRAGGVVAADIDEGAGVELSSAARMSAHALASGLSRVEPSAEFGVLPRRRSWASGMVVRSMTLPAVRPRTP